MSNIKEQDVTTVFKAIQDNPENTYLLDVRTPEEYDEVHAKGAVLLPLQELTPDKMVDSVIPKNKSIYIICRSGNRSMIAAQMLEPHGYGDLINVAGGTISWVNENLPLG